MTKDKNTTKHVDTTKLADAVMGVMQSLTQAMNEEVSCLNRRDYAAMEAVRQEKAKLIRTYQTNIQTLSDNPSLLKEAPVNVRENLRKVANIFASATERNVREIKAALAATQALLQTVMNAARKENKMTDCYSDPRKDPLLLGSYSPVCAPVAVSRLV